MTRWRQRARAAVLALAVAAVVLSPAPALAVPRPNPGDSCLTDGLGLVELRRPEPVAGVRAVPVVFVHGINTDADGVRWPDPLREEVEKIDAGSVVLHTYAFDYHRSSLRWVTDEDIGPRLAKAMMCLSRDYDLKAVVVAFSMGGLATEYAAAQDADTVLDPGGQPYLDGGKVGDRLVEVITIGTPYQGSWLLRGSQQVLPGQSEFEVGPSVDDAVQREAVGIQAFLAACAGGRERLLGRPEADLVSGEHQCDWLVAPVGETGIPGSPVGTALQENASELDDLRDGHPWPAGLRVRAIGADIRMSMRIGAAPVTFRVPTPWSLGDGVVLTGSAVAGGANGPALTVRCEVDPEFAVLDALFLSPCRHTALLSHPEVIEDVVAEVSGAVGSSLAQIPRPVTDIDWDNRAYTTDCAGIASQPFTVDVSDGQARTPSNAVEGGDEYYEIVVADVVQGDLTGDGQLEAAVLLTCKPQPTSPNLFGVEAQVFAEGAEQLGPALKAQDAAPGSSATDSFLDFNGGTFTISDGELTTGAVFRIDGQCRACEPTTRLLTWRWDGERFLPS